jgi:lysine-arginine-ornithine-binding protein
MKRRFISAVLVIGGLSGAAAAQELRVGTIGGYMPWNGVDASGQVMGFDIDLANAICERIKRTCRFTAQPWEGLLPALEQGKYDVLLTGIAITEERKKRIAFTQSYASLPINFAAVKGAPFANAKTWPELKAALNGKTVGVQSATQSARFVENELKGIAAVRFYDNQDSLNLDLLAGRVDAALAGRSPWIALMKSPQGGNVEVVGPDLTIADFPYLGAGVGGALRKDDTDLLKQIDAAICALKAEGALTQLGKKWFGFDMSTPREPGVCGATG